MIIALGWLLARREFISTNGFNEISWLCYWVGLPALLIVRISEVNAERGPVAEMVWALLLATVASIVIGTLIAWLWRLPLRSAVTFVHAGYRGNVTFIGLPVVNFLRWVRRGRCRGSDRFGCLRTIGDLL